MDIWTRIIGVAVLLYAFFVIYRGKLTSTDENTQASSTISRSEKPVQFWLSVAFMLAVAVVMIFNVFHIK